MNGCMTAIKRRKWQIQSWVLCRTSERGDIPDGVEHSAKLRRNVFPSVFCSKIRRLQTCNLCLPIVNYFVLCLRNDFVNKAQFFVLHNFYYLRPKEGQVWTKKPWWLTFLAITVEIVNSLSWITTEICCSGYNGLLWKENKKRGVKKSQGWKVWEETSFPNNRGSVEGVFGDLSTG